MGDTLILFMVNTNGLSVIRMLIILRLDSYFGIESDSKCLKEAVLE